MSSKAVKLLSVTVEADGGLKSEFFSLLFNVTAEHSYVTTKSIEATLSQLLSYYTA